MSESAGHLIFTAFIEDRAKLELEFEKWRNSQIPKARNSVQSFIVFLRSNGLWDDDKVHNWCRDKEMEEW